MKRVLIFSTAYFPLIGGAEVAVKEITDRIKTMEFVMITAKIRPGLSDFEQVGNIAVYRIGKGNKWDKIRLIFGGWKKAKELGRFDMVCSIMASYAGFSSLRFKKKNKDIPFLLTLQEGDSKWHIYKHVWFVWPYFKQIFRSADRIQAISNYLAEWARDMGAKCPVIVVPNGISIEHGTYNTEQEKGHTKIVITASRLVKKNGVGDLIKAMKTLERDNVVLRILGDGQLRKELEKSAKDLDIEDKVKFVGEVQNIEVYNELLQADIFCRPSLSEGLGNAFLEAMIMGVPVIATPVGGIPDFLTDPSNTSGQIPTGWFCQVKNPESIAEKIKYILDEKNKEEVSRVVENAKKMVEEKYSWELISRDMNKIMQDMV